VHNLHGRLWTRQFGIWQDAFNLRWRCCLALLLLTRDEEEPDWLPGSSSFSGLYTPSRKSSTGSIKSVVDTNDSWGTCTDVVLEYAPRSDMATRHFERRTFRFPRHDPDEFFRFSRTKLSVPFLGFVFRPVAGPPSMSRFNFGIVSVEASVAGAASQRPGGGCSDSETRISVAEGSDPARS
jgi:hypothetical protein